MDQQWHSACQPWLYFSWRMESTSMTIFLLSIWCFFHEFIYAIDSIRQLSLSFQWWFQGVQWLCFWWRFMDQQWHSVFENSMLQPWLYFCDRLHASVVNSLTLLIPYGSCHSVFIEDFNVCSNSVLADDLWISDDIAFLKIPCFSHDYFCDRFHASVGNSLTLSIPYVSCHSVFIHDF